MSPRPFPHPQTHQQEPTALSLILWGSCLAACPCLPWVPVSLCGPRDGCVSAAQLSVLLGSCLCSPCDKCLFTSWHMLGACWVRVPFCLSRTGLCPHLPLHVGCESLHLCHLDMSSSCLFLTSTRLHPLLRVGCMFPPVSACWVCVLTHPCLLSLCSLLPLLVGCRSLSVSTCWVSLYLPVHVRCLTMPVGYLLLQQLGWHGAFSWRGGPEGSPQALGRGEERNMVRVEAQGWETTGPE